MTDDEVRADSDNEPDSGTDVSTDVESAVAGDDATEQATADHDVVGSGDIAGDDADGGAVSDGVGHERGGAGKDNVTESVPESTPESARTRRAGTDVVVAVMASIGALWALFVLFVAVVSIVALSGIDRTLSYAVQVQGTGWIVGHAFMLVLLGMGAALVLMRRRRDGYAAVATGSVIAIITYVWQAAFGEGLSGEFAVVLASPAVFTVLLVAQPVVLPGIKRFVRWINPWYAAIVFASAAFLAMVAFGVLWWTSASNDEYKVASARDDVVEAASEGIRAYTEIDPQDPDAFRQGQRAVSTDDLFEQNSAGWEQAKQQIQESGIAVEVEIYDTGVIELNSHRGEAVAITALEITRNADDMEESTGRMRMIAQMQRVDDEWRLADIQHVPETGAGTGAGS